MEETIYQRQQEELYDTVNQFMMLAASKPQENLTAHLAASLGPTFVNCDVTVVWRAPKIHHGAFWQHETGDIASLSKVEILSFLETGKKALASHRSRTSPPYISCSEITDGRFLIAYSSKSPVHSPEEHPDLWILLEGIEDEETRACVEMFRKHTSGLVFLYMSFRALARAGEPVRMVSRVSNIYRNTGAPFSQRLGEACAIIDELDHHLSANYGDEFSRIVVDLAEVVMNEMLGVGWDVQNTEENRGQELVNGFLKRLESLADHHLIAGSEIRDRVTTLSAIIGAAQPNGELTEQRPGEAVSNAGILNLMARWARMYQIARTLTRENSHLSHASSHVTRQQAWLQLAEETVEDLDDILLQYFKKCHEMRFLPSWLRLWFCHGLLLHEIRRAHADSQEPSRTTHDIPSPRMSLAQRWRFRRDLAYVVRECLRHFEFGQRPGYTFQPIVFSEALRTLVEHHAIWTLNLPRSLDIRGLLGEIGRASGSGSHYFAAGHLRHVLEIYIAGQFFCEFSLDARDQPWDGWTMAQVLASRSAWKPGALKRQEFRKAFSIATLLHDVGMLLFPRWTSAIDSLGEIDDLLKKNLSSVREVLDGSAGNLLKICDRELREEGYFNATEEPHLVRWIDEIVQRGIPDHSLLGAWYLHRICQNVDGLSSDTIAQAVRAVLLHSVVTQPIEVDNDPAAALLVLCDEVFMWQNGSPLPAPSTTGRSFQSFAVDVRPQSTLFDFIKISGLRLERGQGNHLFGVVDFHEEGNPKKWPEIEIRLKDPDYLEAPVHLIWLKMAQNLGRLRRSGYGWAPSIRLWSKIPGRLDSCNLDTRRLLEEVANKAGMTLRPSLESWLGAGRFDKGEEPLRDLLREILDQEVEEVPPSSTENDKKPSWEWVRIGPLGHFHSKDIALSFAELGQLVERVLHDEELLRREPPPRGSDA